MNRVVVVSEQPRYIPGFPMWIWMRDVSNSEQQCPKYPLQDPYQQSLVYVRTMFLKVGRWVRCKAP